ncbi:Alpha-(1 3)-fucosyltransferase FucT-like 1, partial [Homarus americanus]
MEQWQDVSIDNRQGWQGVSIDHHQEWQDVSVDHHQQSQGVSVDHHQQSQGVSIDHHQQWQGVPMDHHQQSHRVFQWTITNSQDKELINDMIVPLLHQWTKANALFKPPVINQCRTIELKLTKLWHKAVETSLGKGNLARKNEFLHTLDTLFDILTCKCSIQLCSESNCSHSGKRENNSHIDCGCPREKKIPVLELEFIKAQRTKAEGQGSMQMGSIDYSETKKQIANAKKREQIREREQKKKMKSEEAIQREEELCQDVYHFFDIPPINVNATKLSELVDLSLEVLEPPLTTSLTSQELRNLKETPMQVPKWPSHTQSVERCVKMVTEAAGHVYSHERREGDARCEEDDTRCGEDDARCEEDDARYEEDDTMCEEDDARYEEDDTRCEEDDARCEEDDTRCGEDDARCEEDDARYEEDDARCEEDDARYEEDDA